MAFEEKATLTGIAKSLKETFEGFGDSKHQEEVKLFRRLYGDAECIRIGEMDYIVINEVYKSKEYEGVPENISPLFFNSIKNDYAIIDAETSSTLIDEVYARVTYMQRICTSALPSTDEVLKTMSALVGEGEKARKVDLIGDDEEGASADAPLQGGRRATKRVNIFQCQLVKDTGVSASPDTYSFMLKDGKISEIASHVMRQIRGTGQIKLLKDNEILEGNRTAIQQAVFDKYIDDDLDIQSITVKSIFEININFIDFFLELNSQGNRGFYKGSHLAGENNEFEALNASIHSCNQCGRELVDIKDSNNVHRLHINMDALLSEETLEKSGQSGERIHAVGCEECLEQCPVCGGWHFNYTKLESAWLKGVKLTPGREFISGLNDTTSGTNYCACREWIEWVHDEKSGSNGMHGVIPISKLAFINSAREKLASYDEFKAYCDKKRGTKQMAAQEEAQFARKMCVEFKKRLAARFDIDVLDITVTSAENCNKCVVCGGEYYAGDQAYSGGQVYRCNVCEELDAGNRSTVTRIDGVVFMCRKVKKKKIIGKYIVTKLGNLKRISSMVIDEQKLLEETETENVENTPVSNDDVEKDEV